MAVLIISSATTTSPSMAGLQYSWHIQWYWDQKLVILISLYLKNRTRRGKKSILMERKKNNKKKYNMKKEKKSRRGIKRKRRRRKSYLFHPGIQSTPDHRVMIFGRCEALCRPFYSAIFHAETIIFILYYDSIFPIARERGRKPITRHDGLAHYYCNLLHTRIQ